MSITYCALPPSRSKTQKSCDVRKSKQDLREEIQRKRFEKQHRATPSLPLPPAIVHRLISGPGVGPIILMM